MHLVADVAVQGSMAAAARVAAWTDTPRRVARSHMVCYQTEATALAAAWSGACAACRALATGRAPGSDGPECGVADKPGHLAVFRRVRSNSNRPLQRHVSIACRVSFSFFSFEMG